MSTAAGRTLGLTLDLLAGQLHSLWLEHASTSDRATLLQALAPDTLRLAALGFFDLQTLQRISDEAGYWLNRLQVSTAVFSQQGTRLDLCRISRAFGRSVGRCGALSCGWMPHQQAPHRSRYLAAPARPF